MSKNMPRVAKPAVVVSYNSLMLTYAFMVMYAITAALVSLPSLEDVYNFAVVSTTLGLVATFGAASIIGVIRTRATGHAGFEVVVSFAFFVFFIAYPIVIFVRTISDGSVARLPYAFLAFALCIIPYSRSINIVRGKA